MFLMAYGGLPLLFIYKWERGFSYNLEFTLCRSLPSLFIYFIALLVVKMIGRQDIEKIPILGAYVAPIFPRR